MGKTVGCGCDYCMGRGIRRDFRQGGVGIEDFEQPKYRKAGRRNRRKAPCKKSKTKEVCDFSVTISNKSFYKIMACSRCGKHGRYIWMF